MLEIILREKDNIIYFIFTRKNVIFDVKNKNSKKIYFWILFFLNNKKNFIFFKNKNSKSKYKLNAYKIIVDLLKIESEDFIFSNKSY
jgi:hypothetical protein